MLCLNVPSRIIERCDVLWFGNVVKGDAYIYISIEMLNKEEENKAIRKEIDSVGGNVVQLHIFDELVGSYM